MSPFRNNTKNLTLPILSLYYFYGKFLIIIKRINMTDAEQTVMVKKPTKKETRKEVFEKLSGALAEYKGKLNGKKFENKLKKVSRGFAMDIFKAIKKDRKNGHAKQTTDKK
jgi:hypothetical protein